MDTRVRYTAEQIVSFYRPGCAEFSPDCPVFEATESAPLDPAWFPKRHWHTGTKEWGSSGLSFAPQKLSDSEHHHQIPSVNSKDVSDVSPEPTPSQNSFKPVQHEFVYEALGEELKLPPSSVTEKNADSQKLIPSFHPEKLVEPPYNPSQMDTSQSAVETENTTTPFHPQKLEVHETSHKSEPPPKKNNPFVYKAPDVDEQVINETHEETTQKEEPPAEKQKFVPSFRPQKKNMFVYTAPDVPDLKEEKKEENPKKTIDFAELQKSQHEEKETKQDNEPPPKSKFVPTFQPKKKNSPFVYVAPDVETQTKPETDDVPQTHTLPPNDHHSAQEPKSHTNKKTIDFAAIEREQMAEQAPKVEEVPEDPTPKRVVPAFAPRTKASKFQPPTLEEQKPNQKQQQPVSDAKPQEPPVEKESRFEKLMAEEMEKMKNEQNEAAPIQEEPPVHSKPSFNPKPAKARYEGPSVVDVDKPATRKKGRKGKVIHLGEIGQIGVPAPMFGDTSGDVTDERPHTKKAGVSFSELMEMDRAKEEAVKREDVSSEQVHKAFHPTFNPARKAAPRFEDIMNVQNAEEAKESEPAPSIPSFAGRRASPGMSFQEIMKMEEKEQNRAPLPPAPVDVSEVSNVKRKKRGHAVEDEELFWGTAGELVTPVSAMDEEWPAFHRKQVSNKPKPAVGKRITKAEWLAQKLRDELGDDDWTEFAASIADKPKPDVVRSLSTITRDRRQATEIADVFFRKFP